MLGKRKSSSFSSPDESPSKLAKTSSGEKLARRPKSLSKIPSVSKTSSTKELAMSGSSPSTGGSDLESPTPPLLRKASTLTVDEKEAKSMESLTKRMSSKKSSSPKVSLTKKVSSVVVEGGTVTTVVPLKSGSSIGETTLATKESLKKADSLKKTLSKTSSIRSSIGTSEGDEAATTALLPPGGLLEVAISFDTTGSMYGVLEEVRAKVKDLAQRLQADIPGIRIAVIAHGDYCDYAKYIVKWINFGASLPELCNFVENVERTGGGDGPECYELVLKRAREELAWTPGSQRILVVIGDDEPHPVGYTYNGERHDIDWKEECDLLRDMNVKVYGVQAKSHIRCAPFYKGLADRTQGRHVNLSDFSSIFDFLMMICYREGNPDMMPIYASEVRARNVGGMAKDIEVLVDTFGGPSVPKAPLGKIKALKVAKKVKATNVKPTTKRKAAPPKKPTKTEKKAKTAAKKKTKTATKKKSKASNAKKSTKKSKSKTKKMPKKKMASKKKLLREKIQDSKLMSGALKKLEWTDWMLAISEKVPIGYSHMKFRRSQVFSAFHRKNLFGNDPTRPAIYEVGFKFPGYLRKRVYAMYYRTSYGNRTNARLMSLYIIRQKKVREEISKLVDERFVIYIRRGVAKDKNMKKNKETIKAVSGYLNTFDYAWKRHGKSGHRNVVMKGKLVSDKSL